MGRYSETIIQQLMDSTAALGEHATEMTLPPRLYLNVAADLMPPYDIPPAAAGLASFQRLPVRLAYDYLATFSFVGSGDEQPPRARSVRIGDSFTIQGPRGPVTIREGA